MFRRIIKENIQNSLLRGKSVLLLGPRQTGKTTLLRDFSVDLTLNLMNSKDRLRYEKNPELLALEIDGLSKAKKIPLIFIDEIQKVPKLLDEIQEIIDQKKAQFLLTGSSLRKLRKGPSTNWLPGRLVLLHLDPISISERTPKSIIESLQFGGLPGILNTPSPKDKETDLLSYVETYLEEEIRREGLVRDLGHFSRFLELAAIESGNILNYSKISSDIGVSVPTVKGYFEVLFDCLIAERIEPITRSKTRKKLTKSAKCLFFDLGVRRIAAHEGIEMIPDRLGQIFEQWVGLEILRTLHQSYPGAKLRYWRDPDGPEVDWVIENQSNLIPIEVKWSEHPTSKDAKALGIFLEEYPKARHAYIVSRSPRIYSIAPRITVIPWQKIFSIFQDQ